MSKAKQLIELTEFFFLKNPLPAIYRFVDKHYGTTRYLTVGESPKGEKESGVVLYNWTSDDRKSRIKSGDKVIFKDSKREACWLPEFPFMIYDFFKPSE